MCAITGFITSTNGAKFTGQFVELLRSSFQRGRDGFGYEGRSADNRRWIDKLIPKTRNEDLQQRFETPAFNTKLVEAIAHAEVFIANHRAEPTTEHIQDKRYTDQQPYTFSADWRESIVHNGVIANDKELRKQFYLGSQDITAVDSGVIAPALGNDTLLHTVQRYLRGSMAIAAIRRTATENRLELYRNYQPIYLYKSVQHDAWIFTSLINAGSHLTGWRLIDFPPYSYMLFSAAGGIMAYEHQADRNQHGLVVCSGGLDSTTVATLAAKECDTLMLLHFLYSCKAEDREVVAVAEVTKQLAARYPLKRIEYQLVDMSWLGKLGGSSLTDPLRTVAAGEAGAEFAHEWVPARNTSMIGIAAAYADRYNLHRMYLGLNLEESGAYADNTIEFYDHFNRALAVGTQSRVQIYNPLANMMKHEIVKLALQIGAPIDHAWSCYLGGQKSCGVCGPCFMRRKAFEMNGLVDPLEYEK